MAEEEEEVKAREKARVRHFWCLVLVPCFQNGVPDIYSSTTIDSYNLKSVPEPLLPVPSAGIRAVL